MNDQLSMGMMFMLRDAFSGPAAKISGSMTRLETRSKGAAAGVSAATDQMGAAFSMMAAATAGLAAGLFPVKLAADFEFAMSRVGALSQASAGELGALRTSAKDLGATTAFTAQQVAKAQQETSIAGLKANETIAAMPGILAMASAGQVELALAANINAKALRAFGLEASLSGRVADVLTAAFTGSNTTLQSLGDTLRYAGPVAKTLGVELEQVAAAAALMGDAGIQGSQAGTTFRSGMLRLAKGSKEVQKGLAAFGLTHTQVQAKLQDLPGLLGLLEERFGSMGEAERTAALGAIFGERAVAGWAAMLEQGSAKLGSFVERLQGSTGMASRIAGQQLDNLKGDFILLQSAAEGAALAIGDKLGGSLRPLAKGLIGVLNAVTSLADRFPILTSSVLTVLLAGSSALLAFAGAKLLIANLTTLFVALAPVLSKVGLGFVSTAFAAGGLKAALFSLVWPVGLAIAAVAALKLAWTYDFLGLKTTLIGLWDKAKLVFGALVDLVDSTRGGVGKLSRDTAAKLSKAGLLGTVVRLYQGVYRAGQLFLGFGEGLKATGEVVLEFLSPLWEAVLAIRDLAARALSGGEALQQAGQATDPRTWKTFGAIIGIITGAILTYKAAVILGTAATYAWKGAMVLAKVAAVVFHAIMHPIQLATHLWTGAQWLLNAALNANPIGLVTMAIVALLVVVVLAIKYWDTWTGWLREAGLWMDGLLCYVSLMLPFIAIPLLLIRHWESVAPVLETVWSAMKAGWVWAKGAVGAAAEWLVAKWGQLRSWFVQAWQGIGDVVGAVFLGIAAALIEVVLRPFRAILALIDAIPASVLPEVAVELRTQVGGMLDNVEGLVAQGPEVSGAVAVKPAPALLGGGSALTQRAVATDVARLEQGAQPVQVSVEAPERPQRLYAEIPVLLDGREIGRAASEYQAAVGARG